MKTNIPESLIAELRGKEKTFVTALVEELPPQTSFSQTLYSGTGRLRMLNALYRWYDHAKFTIDPAEHCLVHIGTACSASYAPGSVLLVGSITDGCSPRTEDTITLETGGVSLLTGDDAPAAALPGFDLYDTEAYACALFCRETGMRLVCIKGVSDLLREGSVPDWRKSYKELQKSFKRLAQMME